MVLTIAAVMMASISFTVFHREPGLEGQARAVVTALRGLRAQARLNDETRQAIFDPESRRVVLPDQLLSIDAAEEIVVTGAGHQRSGERKIGISFYGDGSSSGGMISLSTGKERMDITINWISGKVATRTLTLDASG